MKRFFANVFSKTWSGIKVACRFVTHDRSEIDYTKKQLVRQTIAKTLMFAFAFSYFEFILRWNTTGSFSWKFIYPVIFTIPLGLLCAVLTSFFRKIINYILSWVLLIAGYLLLAAQLVYYSIFGSFISFSLIRMGGQVMTTFASEVSNAIKVNFMPLLLMAVPLFLYALSAIPILHMRIDFQHRRPKVQLVTAAALVPTYLLSLGTLFFGGMGDYSPYAAYFKSDTTTEFSLNTIGALSTMALEFFGSGEIADIDETLTVESSQPSESEAEPPVDISAYTPDKYNMLSIDFDKLNEITDDENIKALNDYLKTVIPSEKNEYTGKFKGYNLISICAESFSPYFIDPEITPTLYKLANGGFVFDNYYNSYQSVTTNGEYSFCMGLFPDLSRNKSDGSFKASSGNLLPFCMGNEFVAEGVNAHGYHNYLGSYYSRRTSHPNMGYQMKFMDDGMEFSTTWPTSDLEMMQQSVDDYIGEKRFHAYYMTFSGHFRYNFSSNPMCKLNRDLAYQLAGDRGYSEPVMAYIACNLELEKALTYLLDRLETAGVLDKTVIVLAGDHYPYGLNYTQYNELAGRIVDTKFGKFKSTFICYNSAMEPVHVSAPCATTDILPTLLNLFGFTYDSRLLAGTDVFAPNKDHVAVLSSQSFISGKVMFDSGSNESTYLVNKATLPKNYVADMIKNIKQKMSLSRGILDSDYYRFVYDNVAEQNEMASSSAETVAPPQ